eukprot:1195725-Prorocentrum_minimum.AAC.1
MAVWSPTAARKLVASAANSAASAASSRLAASAACAPPGPRDGKSSYQACSSGSSCAINGKGALNTPDLSHT